MSGTTPLMKRMCAVLALVLGLALAPLGAQEYRDTLPDAQLVPIAGTGHNLPAGQPARYTALLTNFLLQHWRESGVIGGR